MISAGDLSPEELLEERIEQARKDVAWAFQFGGAQKAIEAQKKLLRLEAERKKARG